MKFGPPHEAAEGGIPEYMVSYADMLTIMLAFFIVLFATTGTTTSGSKGEKAGGDPSPQAAGDVAKRTDPGFPRASGGTTEFVGDFSSGDSGSELVGDEGIGRSGADVDHRTVFESLRARFGPEWTIRNCWNGGPPQLRGAAAGAAAGTGAAGPVRKDVWGQRGSDPWKPRALRPGESVLIGGRIYFGEFDATLTAAEKAKLDRAANEIRGKAQRLEIRGHASRRPAPKDAKYHDSWDLAYARSRAVYEYLVGRGIDPKRIRLSAAGDNEPIESDGAPVPVRHNARVEIHLLGEVFENPAGLREMETPQESKPAESAGATPGLSATAGAAAPRVSPKP